MASDRHQGNKKRHRVFNTYFDYSLLFITVFVVLFGLVMIYSASSYVAQRQFGDGMRFVRQQTFAAVLGFVAIFVITRFDYRILIKKVLGIPFVFWFYALCLFLQAYVLVFGREINGKKRWIFIGSLSFQPSEVAKIGIIMLVSFLISRAPSKINSFFGLIAMLAINTPLLILVVKGNLSTALIMGAIIVGICFVASKKNWHYVVLFFGAIIIVGVIILLFSDGYRQERIDIWLDVENHEKGYQILQGLYAIASGGLFGTGLGNSMQKLGYIPEAQNDMIFAIICEELGLVGAIAIIFLFILMAYRIFVIALNAPDLFGSLLCTGVFVHICVQVLLNVAVVTNAVPSTGVPLPFISYGGTSVSILLAEMGVVLAVSNRIRHERTA